jgi:hypothetical protein
MANFGVKAIKTGVYMQRMFIMAMATGLLASATHAATKANIIPMIFHGTYAENANKCKNASKFETITVNATGIIASEGGQIVVRVKPVSGNANKILVDFKNGGGGETWNSREYLEISRDKKALTLSELTKGKPAQASKYFRCSSRH